MDAGALHPGEAEIEPIHELHDGDAEHVLVAEPRRHCDFGQTAQELGEPLGGVVRS